MLDDPLLFTAVTLKVYRNPAGKFDTLTEVDVTLPTGTGLGLLMVEPSSKV